MVELGGMPDEVSALKIFCGNNCIFAKKRNNDNEKSVSYGLIITPALFKIIAHQF